MAYDNAPSEFTSRPSGDVLDSVKAGFTDENLCGEGASCLVYHICLDGLQVAVKRLKSEYLTAPEFVASYRKEFLTGQRLKHDALPVYRRFHAALDEVYIVMDYIDGITLDRFVGTQEGREYFGSEDNAARFLRELVSITGYLHRSGVVHCDLKPANIMIRHSDLSLMLIDLDKSYCDIMDSTHGGTASVSAPLSPGMKPTAFKDFSAIGKIVDEIAAEVPQFPLRSFRRFRDECQKENTSSGRLYAALEPKPRRRLLPMAVIGVIMTVGLFYALLRYQTARDGNEGPQQALTEETGESEKSAAGATDDNIVAPIPEAAVAETEPRLSPVEIDIDTYMAGFITRVEEARSALSSGLTREELRNYLSDLIKSQNDIYQEIIRDTRQRYPGRDIELAVAGAYERSRAGTLFRQFNEAVSDTLRKWDTLSDEDFK